MVTGRASPVRVTIRGGQRLRRFIQRAEGLTGERLAQITARILRNYVLPRIRSRAPRRTGRLRRSLRIIQRGSRIELRGVFYTPMVRDSTGKSVEDIAMDIIEENRDEIRAQIRTQVRRELGL